MSPRNGRLRSLTLAALFWAAGPALIDLMTTAPDVRAEVRAFLPWLILAPPFAVASHMFDGIFIGAILIRDMRNAMILLVAVFAVTVVVVRPVLANPGKRRLCPDFQPIVLPAMPRLKEIDVGVPRWQLRASLSRLKQSSLHRSGLRQAKSRSDWAQRRVLTGLPRSSGAFGALA